MLLHAAPPGSESKRKMLFRFMLSRGGTSTRMYAVRFTGTLCSLVHDGRSPERPCLAQPLSYSPQRLE